MLSSKWETDGPPTKGYARQRVSWGFVQLGKSRVGLLAIQASDEPQIPVLVEGVVGPQSGRVNASVRQGDGGNERAVLAPRNDECSSVAAPPKTNQGIDTGAPRRIKGEPVMSTVRFEAMLVSAGHLQRQLALDHRLRGMLAVGRDESLGCGQHVAQCFLPSNGSVARLEFAVGLRGRAEEVQDMRGVMEEFVTEPNRLKEHAVACLREDFGRTGQDGVSRMNCGAVRRVCPVAAHLLKVFPIFVRTHDTGTDDVQSSSRGQAAIPAPLGERCP